MGHDPRRARQRRSSRTFTRGASICAIGHAVLAGALTIPLATTPTIVLAQAAPASARSYDIPAGSLEDALNQFGREAGILLSFTTESTAGLHSQGLQGSYTVQEGLDALLDGSGLRATRQANGSYTLSKGGQRSPKADEVTLQAVTVRGTAERDESATGTVHGYVARRTATATKTDTPIIETPQTINIVSTAQIEAQGASSVDEALRYTPGVTNDFYGGATYNDYLRLRGFNAPLYSDGMRMPSGLRDYARLRLEPYGLERVEVLKGPSSALYGQASPGGMVNAVRKRPTSATVREVELQAGSFDRIQGAFDFSGAIDPRQTFLYRLTGLVRDSDTQVDFLKDDRIFIAPSLSWQPSDDTVLTVFTHYQRDVAGNSPLPALGTLHRTEHGYLPVDTFLGYPDFSRYEREQFALGYEFEHRFDDVFKARHKLEYSNVEMDYRYPVLYGIATDPVTDIISLTRSIQHTHDTATALAIDNNLQAGFTTGALRHTLLFGLDYSRLDFDSYWGGDFTAGTVDIFNPHYTGRPDDPTLYPDQDGMQYQIGLYIQDQIKWNNWVFSLGGRHDWAKNKVHNSNSGTTARQTDDAFTGRVGLVHLFDNGIAPYVSYSTSFEPTAGTDAAGVAFEPTTAEQLEVGVRYQPVGWQAYVGLSAYHLTQENILTQDPNPPPSNPWAQVQTGEVRVRGIELEGKANLAAGFDLIASYAYQDSEITKTNYVAQRGNRFQLTPVHQAALWTDYGFQRGVLDGWKLGAGVRYVGSRFGDLNNLIELPSFTLFDASLSYDFGRMSPSLQGLMLRVNATNLFDKRYVTSCASLTSANCYYGEARVLTATLKYRW